MLESSHSSGVVLKDMPDEMDKTRMQSPPSYFFFFFHFASFQGVEPEKGPFSIFFSCCFEKQTCVLAKACILVKFGVKMID